MHMAFLVEQKLLYTHGRFSEEDSITIDLTDELDRLFGVSLEDLVEATAELDWDGTFYLAASTEDGIYFIPIE